MIDERDMDNIKFMKNFSWIKHLFLGTDNSRSIETFDFPILSQLTEITILYQDKITIGIFLAEDTRGRRFFVLISNEKEI